MSEFVPQSYPLYLAQAEPDDGQRRVIVRRVVAWHALGDYLTPVCTPNLTRQIGVAPVEFSRERLYLYADTEAEAAHRMERILAERDRQAIERLTREATA